MVVWCSTCGDMNGVWVDPANQTVRVQGGATWGQVDRETQVFGLAVPGGAVSTTGVGGLTLGGGIGWLHRKWGLSCDNLLAAQIVWHRANSSPPARRRIPTCSGRSAAVAATSASWSTSPSGPTVGPEVALAAVFHEVAAGAELMPQWRDLALRAGDEVTTRAFYWSFPLSDELPPPLQGKDVFGLAPSMPATSRRDRESSTSSVASVNPLFDMTDLIPNYRGLQASLDPLLTNLHSYWKSMYLDELNDDAWRSSTSAPWPDPTRVC